MQKAILIFPVIIVFLLFSVIVQGADVSSIPSTTRPDEYVYGFHIRPHYIMAPLDKYLLIRYQDGNYGAIKFTKTEGGTEEWSSAEYEWYFGIDAKGHFSKSHSSSGVGKATDRFTPVLGRLAFNFGNLKIKFKSISLSWSFPTGVSFFKPSDEDNPVAILAPTDTDNISTISVYDKDIRWYEVDPREAWIRQNRQQYIKESTEKMFDNMKKNKATEIKN